MGDRMSGSHWRGDPVEVELLPALSWYFDGDVKRISTHQTFDLGLEYIVEFTRGSREIISAEEIDEAVDRFRAVQEAQNMAGAKVPSQREMAPGENTAIRMARLYAENHELIKNPPKPKEAMHINDVLKTAHEQEPVLADTHGFEQIVRRLMQLPVVKWTVWGSDELDVLRKYPLQHNEIIEAYSDLEPVKLAERCRVASGRPQGWLKKLFTPDEATYYENQVRPLRPKLQKLLERLGPLIDQFKPNHKQLALTTLALQAMLVHVPNQRDQTIGYQRLSVLVMARTSIGTLEQSMENTRTLLASSIAGLDELLEITIPNWGLAATNVKIASLAERGDAEPERPPAPGILSYRTGNDGALSSMVVRSGMIHASDVLDDLDQLKTMQSAEHPNKSVDRAVQMPPRPPEHMRT